MNPVKSETQAAILADDFATGVVKAAIEVLMAYRRDWTVCHPQGKLVFQDDDSATVYAGLCTLIRQEEELPCRFRVDVGNGVLMDAQALQLLNATFRKEKVAALG